MAAKHKVTLSVQPTNPRPSTAERRAAEFASLAGKQADLKQDAAERRAKRAADPPASAARTRSQSPRATAHPRRSNSR
jgi:hypothetical protein